MKRTYSTTRNADGSVTVESHGPLARLWLATRLVWAVVFIAATIALAVQGQWGTGGFALIVGAMLLPSAKKWRRTGAL